MVELQSRNIKPFQSIRPVQTIEKQSEKPLYVLAQKKTRLLIPKVITFLLLGIVFYLGILLNISLLNVSAKTETTIKLIALIVLIITIIFGMFLNIRKANQKYFFYHQHILFQGKQIPLQQVVEIKTKKNWLDKLFRTYSLVLTSKFSINNIPEEIPPTDLTDYVKRLVAYSRGF